jgi:hypothetical protein
MLFFLVLPIYSLDKGALSSGFRRVKKSLGGVLSSPKACRLADVPLAWNSLDTASWEMDSRRVRHMARSAEATTVASGRGVFHFHGKTNQPRGQQSRSLATTATDVSSRTDPSWWTIRLLSPGISTPYFDGYTATSAFPFWLEARKDKSILPALNKAVRDKQYSAEMFQQHCRASLDALWKEFLAQSMASK